MSPSEMMPAIFLFFQYWQVSDSVLSHDPYGIFDVVFRNTYNYVVSHALENPCCSQHFVSLRALSKNITFGYNAFEFPSLFKTSKAPDIVLNQHLYRIMGCFGLVNSKNLLTFRSQNIPDLHPKPLYI